MGLPRYDRNEWVCHIKAAVKDNLWGQQSRDSYAVNWLQQYAVTEQHTGWVWRCYLSMMFQAYDKSATNWMVIKTWNKSM